MRKTVDPGPDLVGGLASMKGSPLLRERMESGERSEFIAADVDGGEQKAGLKLPPEQAV